LVAVVSRQPSAFLMCQPSSPTVLRLAGRGFVLFAWLCLGLAILVIPWAVDTPLWLRVLSPLGFAPLVYVTRKVPAWLADVRFWWSGPDRSPGPIGDVLGPNPDFCEAMRARWIVMQHLQVALRRDDASRVFNAAALELWHNLPAIRRVCATAGKTDRPLLPQDWLLRIAQGVAQDYLRHGRDISETAQGAFLTFLDRRLGKKRRWLLEWAKNDAVCEHVPVALSYHTPQNFAPKNFAARWRT
jgi:hypothetical protein